MHLPLGVPQRLVPPLQVARGTVLGDAAELAVLGLALMVFESFGDDPVVRSASDTPGHTPGADAHEHAATVLADPDGTGAVGTTEGAAR